LFEWLNLLLRHGILGHYIINLAASSSLWAGSVAGLCADMMGRYRYAPLTALVLGIGINLGALALMFVARTPPVLEFLFPGTLMAGLTMAVVTLIVRGAQMEVARRQAEAAQLALTRAELRALRAQINPHFLSNALNTIRYFVRTDPETARGLLLNLSEVFQRALRAGEFVSLQDELRYAEAYLALEKARFDERLHIEWSIPNTDLFDHLVPTLILQPIVENAIVHGIAPLAEGGMVKITIEESQNTLLLSVEDNGPGIDAARLAELLNQDKDDNGAIGLRNVDRRLRTLYGEAYRLVVTSELGGGTSVQIRIPLADTRSTPRDT
jgi:sensor histidine kinase YesM